MKTEIFKTYSDFLKREDKDLNGVSPEFAKAHENYQKDNETNKACWNCSYCSGCSRCSDCSDCSYCSGCSGCSDKKGEDKKGFVTPKIDNIHSLVLDSIEDNGNKLEMGDWHTCDTTHCRAGWVTHLAGEEGKKLEEETSTAFAAMQIYKASSDIKVSPTRFYETNEQGMADIKRCAELESKQMKG